MVQKYNRHLQGIGMVAGIAKAHCCDPVPQRAQRPVRIPAQANKSRKTIPGEMPKGRSTADDLKVYSKAYDIFFGDFTNSFCHMTRLSILVFKRVSNADVFSAVYKRVRGIGIGMRLNIFLACYLVRKIQPGLMMLLRNMRTRSNTRLLLFTILK